MSRNIGTARCGLCNDELQILSPNGGAQICPDCRALTHFEHLLISTLQTIAVTTQQIAVALISPDRLVFAGRCQFCGCTERNPCKLDAGDAGVVPCGWLDQTRMICNNPNCIAQAE